METDCAEVAAEVAEVSACNLATACGDKAEPCTTAASTTIVVNLCWFLDLLTTCTTHFTATANAYVKRVPDNRANINLRTAYRFVYGLALVITSR